MGIHLGHFCRLMLACCLLALPVASGASEILSVAEDFHPNENGLPPLTIAFVVATWAVLLGRRACRARR